MKFRVIAIFITVLLASGLSSILAVNADSGVITFETPTPDNNTRRINNRETINASISEIIDLCLLEWNGVNETMNKSDAFCYKTKETIDGAAYSYKVYANDSSGNVSVSETGAFVENSKPNVTILAIVPNPAIAGSNLTCNFSLTDSEADNLSVNYSWRNGSNSYAMGNLHVANNTPANISLGANVAHFESWNCTIRPYDGYEYGEEESASLTVNNSAPVFLLSGSMCANEKSITLNAGEIATISICGGDARAEIIGLNTQNEFPRALIKINNSLYSAAAGDIVYYSNIGISIKGIFAYTAPSIGGAVKLLFNTNNTDSYGATMNETDTITITANATDSDGDVLIYSVNDSRFNKTDNRTFAWQNGYGDAGIYSILVNASDGYQESTQNFVINIVNVPLTGNLSNVTSNLENLSIIIGDSPNLSQELNETKNVEFKEGNMTIVSFGFNFSRATLNLANISIQKQLNTSSEGSIIIKGIDLASQNQTKTAYIDNLISSTGVCIKDAEISSIGEVSSACAGSNEVWVACPGSNGQHTCELNSTMNKYKVSGLNHSGIRQQQTYCGDGITNGGESCSSCPQDAGSCPSSTSSSSGGGGGGGMIIAAPAPANKTETSNIANTTEAEPPIINQTFNLTSNIPQEANELQKEKASQKKEQQGLFAVTGSIISNAISKNKFGAGLVIFLIISVIAFFIYNKKK